MTGGEKTALTACIITAAVLAAWAVGAVRVQAEIGVPAPVDLNPESAADAAVPMSHYRNAPPSQIPDRIKGRHALYRRPKRPGQYFTGLAAGGWEWFCNPPSEEG